MVVCSNSGVSFTGPYWLLWSELSEALRRRRTSRNAAIAPTATIATIPTAVPALAPVDSPPPDVPFLDALLLDPLPVDAALFDDAAPEELCSAPPLVVEDAALPAGVDCVASVVKAVAAAALEYEAETEEIEAAMSDFFRMMKARETIVV